MLKIAFSGIPLAGKSTILAEVKKVLAIKSRVEDVDDVIHSIPFDSNQVHSFPVEFYCLSTQINQENLKASMNPEILLCDRSVLDHWVDWRKHSTQLPRDSHLEEKEKALEFLYRFWIQTYDRIILLRVDPKIAASRDLPEKFDLLPPEEILDLEEWYLRTIKEDSLKTMEIWNQQSLDEGAQQILKEIYEQLLLE